MLPNEYEYKREKNTKKKILNLFYCIDYYEQKKNARIFNSWKWETIQNDLLAFTMRTEECVGILLKKNPIFKSLTKHNKSYFINIY